MTLKLIIGNKNYSSWSMRPWIAMKVANIPFEETVISLDAPDFKDVVGPLSGTGKVPALIDGDVRVWESLAILEYLAEKFPKAGLWPTDSAARALARAVSNEMHAGFLPLRRLMPMNMWRPVIKRDLTPEAAANVRRIEQCGPNAEHDTVKRPLAHFCLELSERRMPCTPRSWRACILTVSMSAQRPNPTSTPSWLCRPGANGTLRRLKRHGYLPRTRSIGRLCVASRF